MNSVGETVSYVRVSTQAQVDDGSGLETQKAKIVEFAKEKNLVISKFYRDEGISGAIKDRPALLDLLSACEAGKVKTILVYKMDRLARELTISLWLESKFKQHDVQVLSVVDPELGDDPLEKAFRRIAYVFSELERDVITARLKDGRINKAKNGERGSGAVPYGYEKKDGTIVINSNEGKWVQKIFRWRARGFSYTKIIDLLTKFKVYTRRGKQFSTDSIKYILNDSIYCGMSSFGDISVRGVHEAIISKRLYGKLKKRYCPE